MKYITMTRRKFVIVCGRPAGITTHTFIVGMATARAYFNLGQMYTTGNGVDQDCDKALDFFSKPAEAGDLIAQVNLGGLYAVGSECVPQQTKAMH